MCTLIKKFIGGILLLGLSIHSYAQTGKISGAVKSSENKPVEAGTVSLLNAKDSSLVKLSLTDKAGLYEIDKIKYGNYLIKVEAVGHDSAIISGISLSAATLTVKDIELKSTASSLGTVSVSAKRPMIENKIDKMVVNVDASPTNAGLNALEVLEKSPGVTVDNDGNVSLKGKKGVIILIDGKPTYLSGAELANYLRSLPSSQLDQVEVMTQPSAKYDASGNSGVINIVTKKSKMNGFNGTFTTSAIFAKYFKNTNNININWRKGKLNFFGSLAYSHWEGFNDIFIDRSIRKDALTPFSRYTEQHTYGKFSDNSTSFKAGADFFATKKTTFGAVVKGMIDRSTFHSEGTANIYDSTHKFVQYNDATSENKSPLNNMSVNLNFQQKLNDKGSEISADADYVFYNTKGTQYTNNYLYNADKTPSEKPYLLNGNLPSRIDIYSFKSDYKLPLKGGATFEAGIKTSYVKTDNNADYTYFDQASSSWKRADSISNHFIYKENINAAYVNIQKTIKKFSMQLGLRAEQTIADGNQVSKNISFHKNYTQLFPTAYFNYKPNDDNTWGISYGRRIERPGYDQLNPFQYQLDRYTYNQGNPNLQPQFANNIELSYNHKGQITVTGSYTVTDGIINDVLITTKEPGDSNYITYQTSQNIARSTNIGLSINFTKELKKWWTLNVFANVYNNRYKGQIANDIIDVNRTAFSGNFSSQFTFKKGWSAEVSGWFDGKSYVSSNILSENMGMFSVGGSKKFWKDKASLKLSVRDPFYLASFRGTSELSNSITKIHSYWDNRRAILTFTYRFGKTTSGGEERKRNNVDEQNRVKSGGNN
ncbi:MAG: TonB-dependent receptor [Filimonas sp.]|nr:TonB-dependent receptor [Filimonas sp.]